MKKEKFLKGALKGKTKITLSLLVAFMITGVPLLAEKENEVEYLLGVNTSLVKLKNKDVKLVEFSKKDNNGDIPWTDLEPSTPINPDIPWTDLEPSIPIFKGEAIFINGQALTDVKDYVTNGDIEGQKIDSVSHIYKVGANKDGIAGSITNKHNITSNIDSSVGIYAENNGIGINEGNINLNELSTGMMAHNGGKIVNIGNIEAGIGVSLGSGSIGENSGTIIGHEWGYGAISISDNGTIFTNKQEGNITGNINVTEQSSFINEGTINTNTLTVIRKSIFTNNGTITSTGNLNINTTSADDNNRFYDGKLINEANGVITVEGTLTVGRTDHDGGTINRGTITASKVSGTVIDDGGTLTTDNMKGDLVLTGNSTNGSFDKVVVNDKINIDKLDGEIKSDSALYNVSVNDEGKVVLARKDFNSLISDENVANYLENNFGFGSFDKEFLLDNLKNIKTVEELNKAGNDTLGTNFYPNMKKQTKEIIDFNNKSLDKFYSQYSEKDIRVIAGADYKDVNVDSSNLVGYDEYVSNVFFGIDKKLNNNRLGLGFVVGKLDSSYDNQAEREDTFYQLSMYNLYNKNNIIVKNNVFMGMSNGDIKRTLKFEDVNETMKADIDSKYAGINNYFGIKYDFDNFYVVPNLTANFTYLQQDEISEKGRYALTIDENNSYSIEGGIGVEVGKDISLNDCKLSIGAFGNLYHEFGNPYEELDSKISVVSNDKYNISKYERDNYGELGIKLELERNNVTVYTEAKYIFDSNTNYEASLGLSYKF